MTETTSLVANVYFRLEFNFKVGCVQRSVRLVPSVAIRNTFKRFHLNVKPRQSQIHFCKSLSHTHSLEAFIVFISSGVKE